MPSNDPVQRYNDILENIAFIREYTSSTSKDQFRTAGMAYDAVSYCFVRLTEAAIRLGELAEQMQPEIPWGKIRGLGNQLRHAYDGIDPDILWDAMELDFPPLEAACLSAIEKLERHMPTRNAPDR